MKTRTLTSLTLLLLFSVISAPTTRPQATVQSKKSSEPAVSDSERARKEETKDEWTRQEPPRDGEEWFERGYKLHSSDRYPEAIEAFKRAVDLDYRKATAMYNIACGYSLLNDKENAFAWLQRALDSGFDRPDLVAEDSDLDPLRSDPRFKKIRASISSNNALEPLRKVKGDAKPDRLEQANLDFTRLERDGSQDGEAWAKVGARLLMLRDLERSIIALNRATANLDDKGSSAMYNLACAYALKGDRETGIQWLEKSVNAGFDSPEKLRHDPDINSLRSDPRFARVEKLSSTLSLSQFRGDNDRSYDSEHSNYSKERWAPAIELYQSFVKGEPNNGRAWFNLGYALHYSHEHARAIEAFQRALGLGYHKPTSTYNIACGYAMLNQRDAAFEWLDRAIKAGFDSYGDLGWDRDLDSLRSDPRFKRFIDSANYSTRMRSKK